MNDRVRVSIGQSCANDAREAVREFHMAVAQPDMALVMFFCSGEYDLDALAEEMRRAFSGAQVVGCTTAGEIGPAACHDHSISGASFPADKFTIVSGLIDHLQQFKMTQGQSTVQDLLQGLERKASEIDESNTFAFLLIDGMSIREEQVASALQGALGEIPLVGGSAGDGLDFGTTYVYFDGHFQTDGAVLALVNTSLTFRPFKIQHFVPTEERVVVTAADAANRIVYKIDGYPAAEAYARLAGVNVDALDPKSFAASPVVVLVDGTNFVRSIQKANPDGSLTFYSAIEEGVVLRIGRGVALDENLEQAFAQIRDEIGPPQVVLGCDCILRKLEIAERGLTERVESVVRDNNVVGFATYGEQYRGVHVNQTLTGVAIGCAQEGEGGDD